MSRNNLDLDHAFERTDSEFIPRGVQIPLMGGQCSMTICEALSKTSNLHESKREIFDMHLCSRCKIIQSQYEDCGSDNQEAEIFE